MTAPPPQSPDAGEEILCEGRRVVIRYAIDRSTSPHGEGMTDALGVITSMDAQTVSVMTRRGEVAVPRAAILTAKRVPPPPQRRPSAPPPGWSAEN